MAAPFQIIPAPPAETADIIGLEQLCYPTPWTERIIRTYIVAASLPKKGFVARIIMEGKEVLGYAFASRQENQLLVERLGVHPDHRRKGIGSGLMVSLIITAQDWTPVVTCSLDEENLTGQFFLKAGKIQGAAGERRGEKGQGDPVCKVGEGVKRQACGQEEFSVRQQLDDCSICEIEAFETFPRELAFQPRRTLPLEGCTRSDLGHGLPHCDMF